MKTSKAKVNEENELDLSKFELRSGIYFLYKDGDLMYVGQATNITRRILQHIENAVIPFDRVLYELVPVENLNQVESVFIKTLKPICNGTCKDFIPESAPTVKSIIRACPMILSHHKKKDGTFNVKIRITYRRKSFYIRTNKWVYEEDLDGIKLKNKEDLQDMKKIIRKIHDASKFVSRDATFEYVKNKLMKVPI